MRALPSIMLAIDASAECEAALREAGLTHAAAHVHDATTTLRGAARIAEGRLRRDQDHEEGDSDLEPLTTADGRSIGTALVARSDGLADRRGFGDRVTARSDDPRPTSTAVFEVRDLAWEVATHSESRLFVQDDVSAALLARALSDRSWVCDDGTRWSGSRAGATTAVRIARGGRPFATLASLRLGLLDAAVAEHLASLGWRPGWELRPKP